MTTTPLALVDIDEEPDITADRIEPVVPAREFAVDPIALAVERHLYDIETLRLRIAECEPVIRALLRIITKTGGYMAPEQQAEMREARDVDGRSKL